MIRWEYKYVYFKVNTNDSRIEEMLNTMGSHGWELVSIVGGVGGEPTEGKVHAFVFKRPVH